jgi:AAA15 family ATPase/GTPase
MNINKIIIGGYANINEVELNLGKFNALIALNNYGKSNVISSIDFGVDFIKSDMSKRNDMMAYKPVIPINKHIDNKPYIFEVTFDFGSEENAQTIVYGFSFDWIKNEKTKGQRITSEYLKIKSKKSDSKFKTYLSRNLKESHYLPSITGRCDKKLLVQKNELAINKLQNYDDLFYLDIIVLINKIKLVEVDTLQNPDKLFRTINPEVVRTDYSLEMPDSSNVGFFIYSLKKQNPKLYDLFKDSVKSLLPSIEDFVPIEIDLKKEANFRKAKIKIPVDFPEKLYDIQVKEINNNQETNISSLSSGSQKLLYILAVTVAAEINNVPLITFEELENSIHPGLLQRLLIIIDGLTENTKVLMTSHSPYLIQYLDIDKVKIGLPNKDGLAIFKEIKKTKFNKIITIAGEDGISIGDLIFDKMIEATNGDDEFLIDLCK